MKIANTLPHKITDEKGQSFLEFLMLLLVLIGLSYGIMTGINKGIALRWKAIVETVVDQNPRVNLELR